ncbi:PAS domain-containing protein [Shewanella sp. C31]|nr:PAS domain-containing protein [Shewanella electrica]
MALSALFASLITGRACGFDVTMKPTNKQDYGLETVFQHSKDGLAIFKDGIFIDCNQSILELVSLTTKAEFIGLGPIDFSPEFQPDGRRSVEKAQEMINRCQIEGSVRFEWIHTKSDGTPFWCEVIITKMTLNEEVLIHTNWHDISEKKDLELKLAEQKELFETLFNESKDSLSIYDGQRYIDCNKAFLNMFGYATKQDITGLHPKDVSPEFQFDGRTSQEKANELIQTCIAQGSIQFEWLHKKSDNRVFWTEVILTKVVLNNVVCIYAIMRDISEKKQLELQLHQRNAELDRSNNSLRNTVAELKEARDQLLDKMASLNLLVAGVAHEINTPVGVSLTGITQLIEETAAIRKSYQQGALDETHFEEFINSADTLSVIVNKNLERTAHLIRSFKKIAVGQTSEEEKAINLKDYVEEVIFILGSITHKANASISLNCANNYHVVTQPELLSQVLTNLIVNSVVHGFSDNKSGHIAISITEQSATRFQLSYQDDGKGISKANLPKIFDPFFTTNRANGGTGLGLNVTYNIITNALGGSITCLSEVNAGVQFIIEFNVKQRL